MPYKLLTHICIMCDKKFETKNPKARTCSPLCRNRFGAQNLSEEERTRRRETFKLYQNMKGRPKGTKNKNPYPRTESVLQRYKNHPPPPCKYRSREVRDKVSKHRLEAIANGEIVIMAGYKGFFKPQNPQKYKGDPTKIIYRSWWEFKVMSKLDLSEDVEWWQSEELPIPYRNPAKGRISRYFVDFVVKYKNGNTELIEVKPYKETIPPRQKTDKRSDRRWKKEAITYGINQAKWMAARELCKQRNWRFTLLTEKEAPWLRR